MSTCYQAYHNFIKSKSVSSLFILSFVSEQEYGQQYSCEFLNSQHKNINLSSTEKEHDLIVADLSKQKYSMHILYNNMYGYCYEIDKHKIKLKWSIYEMMQTKTNRL